MGNFKIKDMDLYYSDFHALKDINLLKIMHEVGKR